MLWVALALWAVGPVMRESDQAALLKGAVSLARESENWFRNSSYNYDKQYLSYWVVAGWLRLRGAAGPEGTIEAAVREGNLVAVALSSLALLVLVGSQARWSWGPAVVFGCVLFSPVVAFTGVLLSPNLISAAFLFGLLVVLREGRNGRDESRNPTWSRLVAVGLFSWAATAARQDIVLLMPLLALLAVRDNSLRELCRSRILWALALGCLAALAAGLLISAEHTPLPAAFFSFKTFVTYLVGGLGALLLPLFVFAWKAGRPPGWRGVALAGAVLMPPLFYAFLLYTPRHLFVVALGLFGTVFLRRGWEIWVSLEASRTGRVMLLLALLGTVLPWIVGVRMSGWKSGRVVASSSTLYPTTDGFWPLGAYGWFYSRLAHAAERPVDHNQQVWAAWTGVDPDRIPAGTGKIVSSGLREYGLLSLRWAGRAGTADLDEADYVLFDDRTVAKRQLGVDFQEGPNQRLVTRLLSRGEIREVGFAMGRRILLWTANGREREVLASVSVTLALSAVFGGNDFRVAPWSEVPWSSEELEGRRGAVAARSREALAGVQRILKRQEEAIRQESGYDPLPWWILPVSGLELNKLRAAPGDESLWIAVGMLPEFMDVREYAK